MEQGKRGISSSTLKLIAMLAMCIDHVAAVVLAPVINSQNIQRFMQTGVYSVHELTGLYEVMRQIGRVAFPIYVFLLVEGFERTGNRVKYGLRLLGFAVLSEIPFNLAMGGGLTDKYYQNVMFTLLIGFGVMALWRISEKQHKIPGWVCGLAALAVGMALAEWLGTDYGELGVLCIGVMYFTRKNRNIQLLAGSAAFVLGEYLLWGSTTELLAPFGFLFVLWYNGERGLRLKYIFYWFYPVHLLLLYCISRVMI